MLSAADSLIAIAAPQCLRGRRFTFVRPTVDRLSRLTHDFDELVFLVVGSPLAALKKLNEVRQHTARI
jgi:hypothetical protein